MKFKIFRTSSQWFRPETPLDKSKYNLKKIMENQYGLDRWHYEINITSLKQLMQISEDVGQIIISTDDEIPTIEIYDYYRE